MPASDPVIYVLAGVNGAGKSSIGGAMINARGIAFFNPDAVAQRFRDVEGKSVPHANAAAWTFGKELLERAISERSTHAFETTLGGSTIPRLLKKAAGAGLQVIIWYVGLATAALHISRVRERVAEGGHDIPESKIRERWERSPENLIELMPLLSELRVFDNSQERDTTTGEIPAPRLLLHLENGIVVAPSDASVDASANWARSIIERALEIHHQNVPRA